MGTLETTKVVGMGGPFFNNHYVKQSLGCDHMFSKIEGNYTYEKSGTMMSTQKSKPIQIITREENALNDNDTLQDDTSHLQYNLNKEYFDPFNKTPPNDFLIKLYKRFQIYSEQKEFLQ